jgi:hypothetical protein
MPLPGPVWQANWATPLNEGAATTNGIQGNQKDSATILFPNDAAFVPITYQASPRYVWQFDVAVVRVALGSTNTVSYNNPPVRSTVANNVILSTATPPGEIRGPLAMQNRIGFTMEGPMRGGEEFGVEFIDVGIMQTLYVASWTSFTPDGRRVTSTFANRFFLDMITDEEVASTRPWYDSENTTRAAGTHGGAFIHGTDRPAGEIVLSTGDRPFLPISKAPFAFRVNTDLQIRFQVSLVVRTVDSTRAVGDPSLVLTQRAVFEWSFQATGILRADGGFEPARNTGNGTQREFREVTNGSEVLIRIPVGNRLRSDIPHTDWPVANTGWRQSGGFVVTDNF